MKVAKVIGTIWSTRKDEKLRSYKLLVVQPINLLTGAKEAAPIIAADTIAPAWARPSFMLAAARRAVQRVI